MRNKSINSMETGVVHAVTVSVSLWLAKLAGTRAAIVKGGGSGSGGGGRIQS